MTHEEHLTENLMIALEALRRIVASSLGPAYYIARGALEAIAAGDQTDGSHQEVDEAWPPQHPQ